MPRLPCLTLLLLPSKLHRRRRRSRIRTMLLILLTTLSLILPFYIVYKPPGLLIRYFQHRWPDVLWGVSVPASAGKVIALTIDDGPSEYTAQILEILKENDARATWFVIGGQVAGREDALKGLVAAGMELGNHAMHDELSLSLPSRELVSQIHAVEKLIQDAYDAAEATRSPPRYFRPGSGFFSRRLRDVVGGLGYRIVLGGIYPHDAQISYWRVNARHVLSMARPGGIVICHDRRSWTVPMLRKVVPELRRRGYRIVTVFRAFEGGEGVVDGGGLVW